MFPSTRRQEFFWDIELRVKVYDVQARLEQIMPNCFPKWLCQLHRKQNVLPRGRCRTKKTPTLSYLKPSSGFPFLLSIRSKLLAMTPKALCDGAPALLSDLCCLLRSPFLIALAVSALWNVLPLVISIAGSLTSFRSSLKSHFSVMPSLIIPILDSSLHHFLCLSQFYFSPYPNLQESI